MFNSLLCILYSLLFFLTPLVMASNTSELFEFNKMILIYILTAAIVFVWAVKMIYNKTIILKKTFLDIPLLLYVGILGVSTIFSIDVHTSLFGYYGRFNGGTLSIICYILLYYAFVSNITKEQLIKLLKTSLISSFLVILWGLPGRFNHDMSCLLFMGQWNNACWTDQFHPEVRMFSTLGQPNWLGAYLTIHFFIGLFFLLVDNLKEKNEAIAGQKGYIRQTKTSSFMNWNKIILYSYLVLNYICILFTRSRSALGAVAAGFIIIYLGKLYLEKPDIKKFIKTDLLRWTLIFLIPIILFKTGVEKVDRYLTLSDFNRKVSVKQAVSNNAQNNILITESMDIRKIVWQGAIGLGKKYPILGTGPETFAYAYYFVRPISHNYVSEWDYLYNKAHNEFLNYLATTGFVGLGAYLLLIFLFIIWVVKYLKSQILNLKTTAQMSNLYFLICMLAAYLSIHITNFFGFSTTTINLFFFLIPGMAAILLKEEKEKQKTLETKEMTLSIRQMAFIGLSAVFAVFLVIGCVRYWMADTLYAQADQLIRSNDYQNASSLLYNALSLKYESVYEDKLSYALANLAAMASYQKKDQSGNINKTVINRLIDDSKRYNLHSLTSSPKNVLYWKTQAKNYYLYYQISLSPADLQNGVKALDEASVYSPTDPKIPYSAAVFYSLLYDDARSKTEKERLAKLSLGEVNKSLSLKKDYGDAIQLREQLLKKFKS